MAKNSKFSMKIKKYKKLKIMMSWNRIYIKTVKNTFNKALKKNKEITMRNKIKKRNNSKIIKDSNRKIQTVMLHLYKSSKISNLSMPASSL